MNPLEWLREQFSEGDKPSNNRVMAFMLIFVVITLILIVFFCQFFQTPVAIKLPEVPTSLSYLVLGCLGIFVGGAAAGKIASAYKDAQVAVSTATVATAVIDKSSTT